MGEAGVIWSRLTSAFLMNCQLFGLTLLFALPLGLLVSLGSMSRFTPLRGVVKTFVWIIRGTPLMLQIIVIYLGPGLMGFASPWGSSTNGRLLAAVVAFVINYACYFSEIYRGGIESVPVGQTEAGQVLGMTKSQIFFRVTLLQVIKRILAPMGNEVMTLIKDTSLANVIANKEIIMMAKEYSAKGLIWPLFSTALFFLVFVGAMTLLFNWLEKKLSYFRYGGRTYGTFGSYRHQQKLWQYPCAAKHLSQPGKRRSTGHHRFFRLRQNNVAALPELFGNAGYRCDPCGRQNPVGCR